MRTRTYYTESQKALMWDRWKKGESLHQIAALFKPTPSLSCRDSHADRGNTAHGTNPVEAGSHGGRTRGDIPGRGGRRLDEIHRIVAGSRGLDD